MGWEVIIGVFILSFSALTIPYNSVLSLQWIESELPVEFHEESVNSGRETAELLNCSPAMVTKHHKQALKNLRSNIA